VESLESLDTIYSHWQLILFVAAALSALGFASLVVRKIVNRRHLIHRDMVWVEITPPADIAKTPEATEQLFSVIHGARVARRLKEKLYDRSPVTSFEITSTYKDGIRYLLQTEKSQVKSIKQAIATYIPDSKVKEVDRDDTVVDRVIEFKETGHYVLPLTLTSAFEQHDPLSYITGVMTELEDSERITLQLIATPIRLREAEILSHKILGNENILQEVGGRQLSLLGRFTAIFGKAGSGLTDLVGEVYMGTTSSYKDYSNSKSRAIQQQVRTTNRDRPARTLSAFELELMETMHRKVTQPLFQVDLRVLIKSPDAGAHIAAFKSALDGYSVPPYQSLKAKVRLPFIDSLRRQSAVRRLPSLFRRSTIVLAASELASLYHFPSSQVSKTDNLITSLSPTLPAPISLKSGEDFDVVIGENHHHGTVTPIGLFASERARHILVEGGTGRGKTTLLEYSAVQDIQTGNGMAFVDPHGDSAQKLLRYIPDHRIKDIIYFNPADLSYPIGLNLLELPKGLVGDELIEAKDFITEAVISVMRKTFSDDDSGGHRIEYILRNTVQTALTIKDATIFTVFDLLTDNKYRKKIVATLENDKLKNFWKNEFGQAGDMQRVKMAAGVTAKIGRFQFSASAERILGQPKSTINFDDILDGKILICNLAKGLIGEDTSQVFGVAILTQLQLAAYRRARRSQTDRKPFYLYVDEFQNFATVAFVQMLSESRKYGINLIMAEQSTSQQDDQRMVDTILSNVGTVIAFRSGSPSDERILLPIFKPYLKEGDIANLPSFHFYARMSAIVSQEPVSGVTLLLKDEGSEETAQHAIEASQANYATKYSKVAPKTKLEEKPRRRTKRIKAVELPD